MDSAPLFGDRQLPRRSPGTSTPPPPDLISLPQEILEQIFLLLDLGDRLRLIRTCSTLKEVYASSAQLQYSFTLQTSAYVDCPYIEPPPHIDVPEYAKLSTPPSSDMTKTSSQAEAGPSARKRKSALPLSPFEKNELLKAREQRWTTMEAKAIQPLGVKGPEGVYELQEGIFLMCDDYPNDEDTRPHSIRLIPLPSADDPDLDQRSSEQSANKMKFPIADLTMDPTQDLIVVSESRPGPAGQSGLAPTHRFHLLSMSTFKPHPLASLPILDFPPFTTPAHTRQLLQVLGDTLVILVSRYSPAWIFAGMPGLAGLGTEEEIIAWNWKTGRVMTRLALPENGWFTSFALLTPTTFMVTSTSNVSPVMPTEPRALGATFPPVIQVYSFTPDTQHCIIPVQPLDFDYMDDTTPRPVLLAQLEMPRFATGVTIESFDVRPDPAFLPRKADGGPMYGSSKPFTQDPFKGVMVFELHVREPTGRADGPHEVLEKKSYELFLLRETLVELAIAGEERLERARSEEGGEDGLGVRGVERNLSWAEWGQTGARLMDISMRRRSWVCSCSGYRFISIVPRTIHSASDFDFDADELRELVLPPRKSDLLLYDFSPYTVRRSKNQGEDINPNGDRERNEGSEMNCATKVIDEPTILDKRKIWRDDVRSELPYRVVRRDWGERANGVMIDDQRVIIIRTRTRDNGDWSDVNQDMTVLCM